MMLVKVIVNLGQKFEPSCKLLLANIQSPMKNRLNRYHTEVNTVQMSTDEIKPLNDVTASEKCEKCVHFLKSYH